MKSRKALAKVLELVLSALVIIGYIALAWLGVCVMVRLITFCFDLPFSFKIATGVWAVLLLIRFTFNNLGVKDGKHNH